MALNTQTLEIHCLNISFFLLFQSFLYLLSGPSIPFKINGGMLQISGPLNFEINSEWTVTVTASGMDSGNIMELKATFKVLYHHVYFEVKYGYIQ